MNIEEWSKKLNDRGGLRENEVMILKDTTPQIVEFDGGYVSVSTESGAAYPELHGPQTGEDAFQWLLDNNA